MDTILQIRTFRSRNLSAIVLKDFKNEGRTSTPRKVPAQLPATSRKNEKIVCLLLLLKYSNESDASLTVKLIDTLATAAGADTFVLIVFPLCTKYGPLRLAFALLSLFRFSFQLLFYLW